MTERGELVSMNAASRLQTTDADGQPLSGKQLPTEISDADDPADASDLSNDFDNIADRFDSSPNNPPNTTH